MTGVTGSQTESYTFDDVGNRTASHLSSTYGYQTGQFNRLTSTTSATYGFDANGNMASKSEGSNFWRYGWDHENRLVTAATRKQAVKYKYDALGRRIESNLGFGKEQTRFTYDADDALIEDNKGTLTKFINGNGIDNKLSAKTGSTSLYFLADHLGSTNALADSTGAISSQTAYDSFGNPTGNIATYYQFTGREYDPFSGFYYYRARFYDPKLGRFVSEDPIGFNGGDINLYGYVRNRPLKHRDPLGLDDADREYRETDEYKELERRGIEFWGRNRYYGTPWRNPTIGIEAGGSFMFGFFGYGGSYGIDKNLSTGQVCVFRKWSMRTGLGIYGGAGFKFNLGDGGPQRTGATTEFEEYGLDFGKGPAGKLGLRGVDSFSASGNEFSFGFGPGAGFAGGGDYGQRTNIRCWPNFCQ